MKKTKNVSIGEIEGGINNKITIEKNIINNAKPKIFKLLSNKVVS